MQSPDSGVIDHERLGELRKTIGGALPAICSRFVDDCSSALEDLSLAIANQDHGRLQQLAHRLKGASASLGLKQLHAAFLEMEQCAKSRSAIPSEWLEHTREQLVRASSALRTILEPT